MGRCILRTVEGVGRQGNGDGELRFELRHPRLGTVEIVIAARVAGVNSVTKIRPTGQGQA